MTNSSPYEIESPPMLVSAPAIIGGSEHVFDLRSDGLLRFDNNDVQVLEQLPTEILALLMSRPGEVFVTNQILPDSDGSVSERSRRIREVLRGLIVFKCLQPHIYVRQVKGPDDSEFAYVPDSANLYREVARKASTSVRAPGSTANTSPLPAKTKAVTPSTPRTPNLPKSRASAPIIPSGSTATKRITERSKNTVEPSERARINTLADRYRNNLRDFMAGQTLTSLTTDDLLITGTIQYAAGQQHSVESAWTHLSSIIGPLNGYTRKRLAQAWLVYAAKATKLPYLKDRVHMRLVPIADNSDTKELVMSWVPDTDRSTSK